MTRAARRLIVFMVLLGTACCSRSTSPNRAGPVRQPAASSSPASNAARPGSFIAIRKPADLSTHVGAEVRVTGTAANAKRGAMVLLDKEPIYCAAKASWDDDIDGELVSLEGPLQRQPGDPLVNERGEHLAGGGAYWLVSPCAYHLMPLD